jgi:glucose-6-phosphate-specific signal transduction histidine kinase|tara:strand:- start:1300 stop:1545 length:246 start_codon:yes stop_codon:yes gene_type:complete
MSKIIDRDRTPEGRFTFLAEKRVGKALIAIRSVANLSDRKNYAYSADQAAQVIEALSASIEELKDDFTREQRKSKNKFEFK